MDDNACEPSIPMTSTSVPHSGLTTHVSTPATHVSTPVTCVSTPATYSDTSAPSDSINTASLDPFKEQILSQLGIAFHLADHSNHSLHIAYQKYKAYLEACHTYEMKVADGSWIGNKLTAVDLIQLFVSKSFWHSHYKKLFSKVANYPDMVAWLENGSDRPADIIVWGVEKSVYYFKDLEAFLEQKERKKGKGKLKAKDEKRGDEGSSKKSKKKKDEGQKKSGSKKQVK